MKPEDFAADGQRPDADPRRLPGPDGAEGACPARRTPTSPTAGAGRTCRNTPFREYKHWVHEGGISTPLIAHWPAGIAAQGRAARRSPATSSTSWRPASTWPGRTTPRRSAASPSRRWKGKSLAPAFAGKPLDRDAIFWEHEGNRAVRTGDWKLVAKGPGGKWELYDIDADRTELHDLADEQPDRVKEMAAKWEAWAKRARCSPGSGSRSMGRRSDEPTRRNGCPRSAYSLSIRVSESDIDEQGHVNNVAFVRFVQDAAAAPLVSAAPPEIRAAYAWVVRRHEIEYLRLGLPGDELLVRTWVGEPSGATWERFY